MTTKKIPISKLIVDKTFHARFGLSQDAIERYVEMYRSGKQKAIKVQEGSYRVIDGIHRLEAARIADVDSILCDILEVPDHLLRQMAYKLNDDHGVPLSKLERDTLIANLYYEDGMTQNQISELVGLAQRTISEIITNSKTANADSERKSGDKRKKITDNQWASIVRLSLGGETQEKIAESYQVTQSAIAQGIAKFKNQLLEEYTNGKRKSDVAKQFSLTSEETDAVLREYGDPLNFELNYQTVWTGGRDPGFGIKHPGNLPAMIAQNLFALYTKPGDLILDPFCGGGMTLDVASDMVARECIGFDLHPVRPDIQKHDLLERKPKLSRTPDFIFLDPPYGPQKEGSYSDSESDLSNISDINKFSKSMTRILGYWESGKIALCMSSLRRDGQFFDLPVLMADAMRNAGWILIEHIISVYNEPASETGYWIENARKGRWLLRKHLHILVGQK